MEPHDFDFGPDVWPSQAPPSDFADRCVSAMLDAPAPKSHRRWLGKGTFFFLAAALCGSSAWATGQARASAPPVEVARFTHALPMPAPEPVPQVGGQVIELTPVVPEPEHPEPDVAPPRRSPARPPKPAVEVEAVPTPSPPPLIVVPRCACDQDGVVCSCF